MEKKYRVSRPVDDAITPRGEPIIREVVSHIEGKLCGCGRLLPLSHKGPCPNCGSTLLKEVVIPKISDIREARHGPIETQNLGGATD